MPKTQTPPKPDFSVDDQYSEFVTHSTVTERIDPALREMGFKGVQVSGRIESASDIRTVCSLTLAWDSADRVGSATMEDIPIETLDALAALIPALVERARRDGIYDWPCRRAS